MRLVIVICTAAALSLWTGDACAQSKGSIVLAFGMGGDQNAGSFGFGDPPTLGSPQVDNVVTTTRRARKIRQRSRPPGAPPAMAEPQGNSREALYARCRSAVFRAYGREYVYPDGRRARALPASWLLARSMLA